jgi:L-arabinokinase
MRIVIYASSHGFGHATRDIELVNAIRRKRPDVQVILRTGALPGFIRAAVETPIELQVADTDTGVQQIDGLELDEEATVRQAGVFYRDFARRADAEAEVLRALRASVVVGDVPPLAFAAAARAGVPSIALANFTWDWIYAAYPLFDDLAPHVLPVVRDAYAAAGVALRLPLHGGFEPMRHRVEDIPLIARHARNGRARARRRLGIDEQEIVALASFGRYGARLQYAEIARQSRFVIMVTSHEVPLDDPRGDGDGRLLRISESRLAETGLGYPDLVAAADLVVTKPGYGIVSECIANGTSLLYTSRGRFAEHDVFVREMPAMLRCRYISLEDLRAGRWADGIQLLLGQTPPRCDIGTHGADVAAERILAEATA